MTGAVIIKMIRSTRTTSMNGIMLISDRTVWVLPFCVVIAIFLSSLGNVQHFDLQFIDFSGDIAETIDELVISDDRGNRREQAKRRGQQSFGNARPHRLQGSALRVRQFEEGRQNADNRAEQTHKWRSSCCCRKKCQPLF